VVWHIGIGLFKIGIGPLLVFDAFLDVLIIEIELTDLVVGTIVSVVVRKYGFQGFLLLFRLNGVVFLFLR